MKEQVTALLLAGALSLASISCEHADNVIATLRGEDELSGGDQAPFSLEQNYPNPFNVTTQINYRLTEDLNVRLKVYTEDWQEAATLVNQPLPAGYYNVMFYASSLPSGEYYYVLEGGGFKQVRRMRLVK